jgi:hypothetical protein
VFAPLYNSLLQLIDISLLAKMVIIRIHINLINMNLFERLPPHNGLYAVWLTLTHYNFKVYAIHTVNDNEILAYQTSNTYRYTKE